jgi:ArsR family transcriptional regulator
MRSTQLVSDSEFKAAARYCRVLADPTRIQILLELARGERTVSDLVAAVGVPRSRISNHLACLKWCRLVDSRRQGRNVVYRVTDPRVVGLVSAVRDLSAEHASHLASCTRIGPEWI